MKLLLCFSLTFLILQALHDHLTWTFLQICRLSCFVSLPHRESVGNVLVRRGGGTHVKTAHASTQGSSCLTALQCPLLLAESRACCLRLLWGTWKLGGARGKLHRLEKRNRAAGSFRRQSSFEMVLLTLERAAVCNVMGPEESELFPWDKEIYYSVFSIPATIEGRCTSAAGRRPVWLFCSKGAEKAGTVQHGRVEWETCAALGVN